MVLALNNIRTTGTGLSDKFELRRNLMAGLEDAEGISALTAPTESLGHTRSLRAKRRRQMNDANVLDACCGSRMFWFDRSDQRGVFIDKRAETHVLADSSSSGGMRELIICPDIQAVRCGKKSWLAKKYGKLEGDWREDLRRGFAECFRVLKPDGTLIFKWNENDIPVSQILTLTPERPLFGNRCGKSAKSHWIVFMKPAQPST